MSAGRKVLVIGAGAREHALALKLLESSSVAEVVVAPGNAGTEQPPSALSHKVLRNSALGPLEAAVHERPDLVVVGPEAPLCEGVVDDLTARGFVVYGPSRRAARLEGSKAFMKAFAERHGIRTARHVAIANVAELDSALHGFTTPPVVKADGLCAGKGVVVATSMAEAREAASAMLEGARFGAAGRTVVLEERLVGAEASVHAICDGTRALILPAAQDHKRIGEGDTGPNTGGMGTYAPAALVDPDMLARIRREMVDKTLQGMAAEGAPFRGTLFAGLMITEEGTPYLLEYNVRFGDPETQVLMGVLDGDLAEALSSAARGALEPDALRVSARHAVCVVLASAGYPESARSGDVITGLDQAEQMPDVRVYHAGTRRVDGVVQTAGGRVLGVTGHGLTLREARDRAYAAADRIRFDGQQIRRDIAHRALGISA